MRARWGALLAVGLWTLACKGDGAEDSGASPDKVFEVDCIGMALEAPNAGSRYVTTRFSDRCVGLASDTLWGGDLELWADGQSLFTQNGMALTVNYGGHTYVARSGRITMNWVEEGVYAAGDYDVTSYDENDQPVRLRGKMEWCDFARSAQCPYQADNYGLDKAMTFEFPDGYAAESGTYASDCRVLIDPDREAVQVDAQIGVFRDTNTAMVWLQCGWQGGLADRFRFRSGGVPGPGTYAYTTQVLDDPADPYGPKIGAPGFVLDIPKLYFGWTCLLASQRLVVTDHATDASYADPYTADPTECTFTIEEDPGHFSLDCENARKIALPDQFLPTVGPFHFESDCEVRYTTP